MISRPNTDKSSEQTANNLQKEGDYSYSILVIPFTSDIFSVYGDGALEPLSPTFSTQTVLDSAHKVLLYAESVAKGGDYTDAINGLNSVVNALTTAGLNETKLFAQALLVRGRMHFGAGDIYQAEADTLNSAALFVRLLETDSKGVDFLNQELSQLLNPHTSVSPFNAWSARTSLLSIQVRLCRLYDEGDIAKISSSADELIATLAPHKNDINHCRLFAECLKSRSYCQLLSEKDNESSRIDAALLQERGYSALKEVLTPNDEQLVTSGIELAELWCYSNQVDRAHSIISEVSPSTTEGSLPHVEQLWITAGVYLRAAALIAADPTKITQEPLITNLLGELQSMSFFHDRDTTNDIKPSDVIKTLTKKGGILLKEAEEKIKSVPLSEPWIREQRSKILQQKLVFAALVNDSQLFRRCREEIQLLDEKSGQANRM